MIKRFAAYVAWIIVLFSFQSNSESIKVQYRFNFGEVTIARDMYTDAVVSSDCHTGKVKPSCEALKKYLEVKPEKTAPLGGASIGSLICRNQLKGVVVIGTDKNRNERSFCKFSDSSLIDIGSLIKKSNEVK